ncbi:MAG: DoxX family protein [Bacteroidota bacterium]
MKSTNIIYWISTGIMFLFEGVMPALTGHSDMSRNGIMHLGYPEYFITLLVSFKVLGALALIIPQVPARLKEWAYAGFTFNIISAIWSNWAVDGFTGGIIFILVVWAILAVSYLYYHKRLAVGV